MNCINKNKTVSQAAGFTLIELLVVISIISFLSSVVLGSLNNARIQARDTQRISDIRQMRIALELYRNTNGTYPSTTGVSGFWVDSTNSNWSVLQTALAPYMPKLPKDPTNNGPTPWVNGLYGYAYLYDKTSFPVATTYDLVTQLENTNSPYRAAVKPWILHAYEATWYSMGFSPYLYAGEY